MSKYETKYAIGELVYTADRYDVDRDVIKAIKIVGVKEDIEYGIKSKRGGGYDLFSLWGGGDGYNWYETSQLFPDKESAKAHHENLKTKYEAEEAAKKAKDVAKRKLELKNKLKRLEKGLSEYDSDEDEA